jgi:hypothetical protein
LNKSTIETASDYKGNPINEFLAFYELGVDWMDASRRGYLKMSFTATQARGDWVFVDTVQSRTYTVAAPAASETRVYRA